MQSNQQPDATTLVELLFFAYRDFVGEPDRVLANFGFGRAHHRVLHFVNRNPGLTIAALLDILAITKQSLSRVLRDLVEGGFIEQKTGSEDRRQRRLHLTGQGKALAGELLTLQTARIQQALADVPPESQASIALFLFKLIDEPQLHTANQDAENVSAPSHPHAIKAAR